MSFWGLKPTYQTTQIRQQIELMAMRERERKADELYRERSRVYGPAVADHLENLETVDQIKPGETTELSRAPFIQASFYGDEQRRQARVRLEIAKLKHEMELDRRARVADQLYRERCRVYGQDVAEEMERRDRAIARIRGEE